MRLRTLAHGLAARLRDGETLYGLLVKMPAPAIVELGIHAGFDFVVLDMEHGAADYDSLEHHLRAADGAGAGALVRVGTPEPIETLRALDAGATGVIVPHVNDTASARAAVRAAHYPPFGERGFAVSTRAARQGISTIAEHLKDALENTLVVVQAEHARALDHVRDIASTKGVDAVFLGPNDLALSLGHPGEPDHPSVVAATERIVEMVLDSDAALCVLVKSEREARVWENRGARLILFLATALLGERLRQIVEARQPPQGVVLSDEEVDPERVRRNA